ncbi:sulfite exporter TauE/SafE family protein [Comamonas sp. w2-DMI]|uniref:sulfite exporter TauE/SafE family protein n=1 Tax=Comamonas sp. w2-DMI TaxID=3126391 RepID=UPI0032E37B08
MEIFIVVALGAAVAGFVQGLSGFAFGMVAMSFWAWVLEPRLAATLAVFGALTGQLVAAFSVRRGFDWRQLAPFLLGGLAGIPLGVSLLPRLDMDWFRLVLGLLLVLWCPAMLLSQRLPRLAADGRLADGAVGLAGGIMGGIGGFTGTLPTLWCTLRGYERDVQRAIIQNFNLSMLLVTMGTYLASGIVTRSMWPWFATVLPAMLIPSFIGTRVYIGISDMRFRQIVLGLLTFSGLALLVSALPKLWLRLGAQALA